MLEMGGVLVLGRVTQVGTMMMRMAAMGGRGERGGRPYPSKKKFLLRQSFCLSVRVKRVE